MPASTMAEARKVLAARRVRIGWVWLPRIAAFLYLGWYTLHAVERTWVNDAYAYWSAWQGGLYDVGWNESAWAFVYSPVFAQVTWPLTLLSWESFLLVWTILQVAALAWLIGPIPSALLLAIPHDIPVVYTAWFNVYSGNIGVFLAVAVVLSLQRSPAAWSFVLLTKVTPGIGLAWHAARREPRALGIALGVTIGLVAISALLAPTLWLDWLEVLVESASVEPKGVPIPLWVRIPLATAVIVFGALRGWPWLVPVGVMTALPQVGVSSLIQLLAIPRLLRPRRDGRVRDPHA